MAKEISISMNNFISIEKRMVHSFIESAFIRMVETDLDNVKYYFIKNTIDFFQFENLY